MKLVKEIKSKEGVLHFRRYLLLNLGIIKIYIHHIFQSDTDLHLHNHPWNFISLTLSGEWVERLETNYQVRGVGSLNFKRWGSFHKIDRVIKGPVKSLFITWGKNPDKWGFLVNGVKIDFDEYRELKRGNKL